MSESIIKDAIVFHPDKYREANVWLDGHTNASARVMCDYSTKFWILKEKVVFCGIIWKTIATLKEGDYIVILKDGSVVGMSEIVFFSCGGMEV